MYLLRDSKNLYATVLWWGDAASIMLTLGVIFEVAWHFVQRYQFLRLFLTVHLRMGCGPRWVGNVDLDQGSSGNDLALEWIILTERSARFLQVCLLIVASRLLSRLGLTCESYSLGIAAGLGVFAALDLVLLDLRAHLHVLTDNAFVLMRSGAYNLGVIIWAFYFLWPHRGSQVDQLPGTDLAKWNDALTEHVDKWYRR